MSQDYAYKRQRISESHPTSHTPLATLDNNVSHIPTMMSNFKKKNGASGKRLSMINKRHSSIGPPRLSSFGIPSSASSLKKTLDSPSSQSGKVKGANLNPRKASTIGRNPKLNNNNNNNKNNKNNNNNNNNRLSIYSQSGMFNGGAGAGGISSALLPTPSTSASSSQNNNTHTIQRDPRPLRDGQYQETMRQEIHSYLIDNHFEINTKHLLTEKTLRAPTQKDFVAIFNWLFKQIDPGHTVTKSLESDVTLLLKVVQYPYLSTINKSQISAVGGHNWHVFLGMLHWLVKCSYFDHQAAKEVMNDDELVSSSIEEIDLGDKLNNMFFKYMKNAYQLFSMDKDNYEPLKEELQAEFDGYMQLIERSVTDVEAEYQRLFEKYNRLVKEDETIEHGNKRSQALETDILKFKEYIKSIEARKIKWNANVNKMTSEVNNLKSRQLELAQANQKVVQMLTDHGLNLNDVKGLIDDKRNVIAEHENMLKSVEESTAQLREHENEARKHFDVLQDLAKDFNSDIYSISNIAASEYQYDLDIEIQLDDLLAEEKLGLRSDELLKGQDLRTTKKQSLKDLQKRARDKNFKIKDEIIKQQNSIDLLSETSTEKTEYYSNLEAKLSLLKIQSDELYNTITLESNASNTETEKLEMQLQSLRTTVDSSLLDIDQKIHSKEIEHDGVLNETRVKREQLHKDAEKVINEVISFKMDIQESLETLSEAVSVEYLEETG
ncbi:kinetochore-associated Ndc80 complex subunit [Saccharomycopsis crataegensis]|uniref:Kinetochore protein NDC80 n=1 Tax=Saccharomycopsis crataegensis TaxID=43959 RepID=A0AAV5QGQ7_9ASCO|nr:kinetochore-associated Ndc80 complex subunit [Saccharomycopsis crataegensis]